MENKDKVSYSVIAGELRKSARLYEVFKHASEAADTLAQFEIEQKRALKNIQNLTEEALELDAKCDASVAKCKAAEEATKSVESLQAKLAATARADAKEIVNKAKEKAEKLVAEGQSELEAAHTKLNNLASEIKQAENSKASAIRAAQRAEAELRVIKDKFLKAVE